MEGFLLVDKPVGLSSFQIVAKVRRVTGVKKVGHAGTLDPFASGLLIVAVGKNYTRRISEIQGQPKRYVTSMVMGVKTDTDDAFGTLVQREETVDVSEDAFRDALGKFVGGMEQLPPAFSAKKVDGKRAYKLARQGETPDLKPCPITIYSNELLWFEAQDYPLACIETHCSKGTYVRSLVRDVATALGTVAYAKDLIRTAIGDYSLNDALEYATLTPEMIAERLIT